MLKLCVFDFDSTLMDGETIDFLAEPMGIGEQVAAITEKAMQGELDFFESLTTRVGLLKGLDVLKADAITQSLPYMPGAKETIKAMKDKGMKVIVFSGGFRHATDFAKGELGFDADFANVLHVKNDKLTGLVGGDMMFDHSKGDMMRRLQTLLGISPEETMAVGDGANDRSMFAHAKFKVAFCAKPILKDQANIIVDNKDLTEILNYL